MRLFVAAELPQEIIEALAETSALLRGCVRGRYIAPDSFHVTLAFLGNVEGSRVDGAVQALAEACQGLASSQVALGDLGSFGKRSKATLWQGFREQGALPQLAQEVRGSLSARGFEFDAKSFVPHVTLMRAADLTAGELPMPVLAKGTVCSVTLFSSDLSGKRPVYEPVHSVVLR